MSGAGVVRRKRNKYGAEAVAIPAAVDKNVALLLKGRVYEFKALLEVADHQLSRTIHDLDLQRAESCRLNHQSGARGSHLLVLNHAGEVAGRSVPPHRKDVRDTVPLQ